MERKLGESLKLVDVVIEVVDARLPISTLNPRLRKRYTHRPTLLLLNKTDLADPEQNKRWRECLKGSTDGIMLYESLRGGKRKNLINTLIHLGEIAMKKREAKGLKRRPIRVLVVGMPNVGKSTVINSIVARKKTKTGHKAGVTRATQWVRIHEQVELLDTPGVIPPSLDSEESGALLACVSSVGEAAYDEEEVALFLLNHLEANYPGICHQHYQLSPETPLALLSIAESRNYKMAGNECDKTRAARAVLSDFRQGRLGRITLEHANENKVESEREKKNTETNQ